MNTHLTALGLTLLHVGWQALVVAAVYRLSELFLTRLSDRARYRLGLAAMMTVLALALATFVYEEVRLANTPMPTSGLIATTQVLAPQILTQATPWLDLGWALGVALLSLRLIGGLWFIARLPRAALPADPSLTRRFEAMADALGLKGKVALRLHPRIDGPFVTGVLRSIVYLPLSAATSLTPAQLDAVLSHELEHVLRRDYAWNLAQSLVEILFFFHPAVWWLGGRLREQRELICDDAALLACREPLVYATALLQLEEGRRQVAPAAPQWVMALNGHRRNLFWRIARILDEDTQGMATPSRLLRAAGAVLALPLAVTLLVVFAPPVAKTAAQAASNLVTKAKATVDATSKEGDVRLQSISDATEKPKPDSALSGKWRSLDTEKLKTDKALSGKWSSLGGEVDGAIVEMDKVAADAGRRAAVQARENMKNAKYAQIDADRIAQQARADAHSGGYEISIDAEAIAQAARSDAVKAQVIAAKAAAEGIDANKIAAQVRVEMKKHRVEIKRVQQDTDKVKAYNWEIHYDDVPTPPETPAPLAEVTPPTPPAPPAAPRYILNPRHDVKLVIPDTPVVPTAPRIVIYTPPPAPPAPTPSRLGALPAAKPSALPAPKASEDRIVILAAR
jgi:beta-lactamase regulating signal transducer with metallopeptidase domain